VIDIIIIGDFAPRFVELTDHVLFGDVWERPELRRGLAHCGAATRLDLSCIPGLSFDLLINDDQAHARGKRTRTYACTSAPHGPSPHPGARSVRNVGADRMEEKGIVAYQAGGVKGSGSSSFCILWKNQIHYHWWLTHLFETPLTTPW